MPSNVINLNAELAAREDTRALTLKQEITVQLLNHNIEQQRLKKAIDFHRRAFQVRLKQLEELNDLIELQEGRLLL
ncbi:MAG: hypothetical protein ABS23_11605 [SAR92 bacterium BACL16 MAG-120619-bin48]|jgi:hypothetical protein|nr:MAG: hypothetical protein ABS23_11605 [SAR92 bacterium BACL16 MAG-120619-bin48]HAU02334.1 hypothetical protein [Porticoccaceae bacterium]